MAEISESDRMLFRSRTAGWQEASHNGVHSEKAEPAVKQVPYEYHNLPIPGGGYVTGIVFHPRVPGVLYIRTDIGGCYRFDYGRQRWISLIDHVTMEDLRESYPIALALAPSDPGRLYIVCGIHNPGSHGKLCISEDQGTTFRYVELPFYAHGNLGGRASGERLLVDPVDERVLYYASQTQGLWISRDAGQHWSHSDALEEQYLTFVFRIGPALLVGTAGVTTGGKFPTEATVDSNEETVNLFRGRSLFVSYDGGEHFQVLEQPVSHRIPGVYRNGQAAMRAAADEAYVYVTFESSGPGNYQKDLGYGCDGGQTADGRVFRYPILGDGKLGKGEDITPAVLLRGAAPFPAYMLDSDSRQGAKNSWQEEKDSRREEKNSRLCEKTEQPELGKCSQEDERCLPFGICGVSCAATRGKMVSMDGAHSFAADTKDTLACDTKADGRGTGNCLVISTVSKRDGDCIFRSADHGDTWQCILHGMDTGVMDFRTPYMKPECNGGGNLIHWMSDLKINPFDADEAWFTTGTGIFRTENLTGRRDASAAQLLEERENNDRPESDTREKGRQTAGENATGRAMRGGQASFGQIKNCPVHFSDWCDGLEETVHLGVYAMPEGPVQVLDVVGDLGGFAFTDLDRPCHNSFADANDERYITCMNVDFPDADCRYVVATPRGNWRGVTKGGLIWSEDYGQHFRRIPMPWGLRPDLDAVMHEIEEPNVNSGWAALSADHQNIAWTLADGSFLPMNRLVVSNDGGKSFFLPTVFDLEGNVLCDPAGMRTRDEEQGVSRNTRNGQQQAVAGALGEENRETEAIGAENRADVSAQAANFGAVDAGSGAVPGIRVFSDRSRPSVFYGFGEKGQLYVSMDCGHTFRQQVSPLPSFPGAWIDCADPVEIRGEAGREGVFYLALGREGLWKLQAEIAGDVCRMRALRLSEEGMTVYRAGLGRMPGSGSFAEAPKAIYCNGILRGVYGFYRSFDDGRTWERINTDRQMFGDIICIDGDRRTAGRFYLATGSRGLLYGQEA